METYYEEMFFIVEMDRTSHIGRDSRWFLQ